MNNKSPVSKIRTVYNSQKVNVDFDKKIVYLIGINFRGFSQSL